MTDELKTTQAVVIPEVLKETKEKLAFVKKEAMSAFIVPMNYFGVRGPWSPWDIDKLESIDTDDFTKLISSCIFFYEHDPLVSTAINKLIDIAINDFRFEQNSLSDNEFKVFQSMEDELLDFARDMALEYLLSGLVIPEISYTQVNKDKLKRRGIKKYDHLLLPTSMWIRDPTTIKIQVPIMSNEPSYFVIIPQNVITFILSDGTYPDGTKDPGLFAQLQAQYGDFIAKIKAGEKQILLDNPLIFRRKVKSTSQYPTPYLKSALEALEHKRNMRRMDYSVAARVIEAIQLITLGSDKFPVTEEDADQFSAIRDQMTWRYSANREVERVFQLFGNHTLNIQWIVPPVDALLNDSKYKEINGEILYALGMGTMFLTGEAQRSGSASAELSTIPVTRTMETFREEILDVLEDIFFEIADQNNFSDVPDIDFKPIQLNEYAVWTKGLFDLYNSGNLSRTTLSEEMGFSFEDEIATRKTETDEMKAMGVDEFAPQAFTPPPTNSNPNAPKAVEKPVTKPKTTPKPVNKA